MKASLRTDYSRLHAFPLLGPGFVPGDYCHLDLNVQATRNAKVETYEGLDEFVTAAIRSQNARIGWGGYGEHRALYRASSHFTNEKEERCIHLGIDLWGPAGTPVYAPLDARVHSFGYNAQEQDYGATIILRHELPDGTACYTLYGHLNLASLDPLFEGKFIARGTVFTALGERHENGGWPPHLHFQLITDMLAKKGDYPGVATRADAPYYLGLCPDPFPLTGIPAGA